MTVLKGITWNHSRGYTPLVACCQRNSELHPGVHVEWQKRSLQAFADFSVEALAKQYDLLIIDHPSVGEAFETRCLIDFKHYINKNVLEELAANSTGLSYQSYTYKDAQLALPLDAATPVSCYRKDLFQRNAETVPQRWEEVIALACKGRVAMPAIPIDMLMNFYMFCIAGGNKPFTNEEEIIDEETGLHALHLMSDLYSKLDSCMFYYNPIAVAELMSSGDDYWYCPFIYGYSNYARKNYAVKVLTYNDVAGYNGEKFYSTIGGTGIAVSAYSKHINEAINVAAMLVSADIQSGLYIEHGGQPVHISAWNSSQANVLTDNYFRNTLPALERAYMRPRYNGYLQFQEEGGNVLHDFFKHRSVPYGIVLQQMNKLYRNSLKTQEKHVTA